MQTRRWDMRSAVSCISKGSGAQHLVRRVSSCILIAKYDFARNCDLQQISEGELAFSGGISPLETCLAEALSQAQQALWLRAIETALVVAFTFS